MKHDQYSPDEQELQMLAHFRAHSGGEPSAELDAQILAAARAAITSDKQPSWNERLHAWLFGAGGRQRWSLALAGLACLGVGVSLTWRTLEQSPDAFDAVPSGTIMAPAAVTGEVAPLAAPMSAPMAESAAPEQESRSSEAQSEPALQAYSDKAEQKKQLAPAAPAPLQEDMAREALADQQPQLGAAAEAPAAKALARSKSAAEQQLHGELQRLLKLRRDGWVDEADALLLKLMRDYPQLNIDAELKRVDQAQ
ncbi:hypothetical protein [Pseudomonas sp.]|uniref:hypothetical protein n=1 Tax=Pseudomonas sp. TaxID=306 RepID=UPI002733A70C|nr:hypothetical protein [Pseudomonas sp.]MDP3815970.1 hypothetical protein [Pseudomonas sp.]